MCSRVSACIRQERTRSTKEASKEASTFDFLPRRSKTMLVEETTSKLLRLFARLFLVGGGGGVGGWLWISMVGIGFGEEGREIYTSEAGDRSFEVMKG